MMMILSVRYLKSSIYDAGVTTFELDGVKLIEAINAHAIVSAFYGAPSAPSSHVCPLDIVEPNLTKLLEVVEDALVVKEEAPAMEINASISKSGLTSRYAYSPFRVIRVLNGHNI